MSQRKKDENEVETRARSKAKEKEKADAATAQKKAEQRHVTFPSTPERDKVKRYEVDTDKPLRKYGESQPVKGHKKSSSLDELDEIFEKTPQQLQRKQERRDPNITERPIDTSDVEDYNARAYEVYKPEYEERVKKEQQEKQQKRQDELVQKQQQTQKKQFFKGIQKEMERDLSAKADEFTTPRKRSSTK